MDRKKLDIYEKLVGQLESIYDETQNISKKAPNDAINKFKLGFINSIITESNSFLGSTYLPFSDFVQFDVDNIPTNSDVVFILSQYLQCFEKYKSDNTRIDYEAKCYWQIEDKTAESGHVQIITRTPRRLKGK